MTKTNKLWTKCLALIKDNVSEQQYRTWFQPIAFESFNESDRSMVLRLPSQFVYEYLEENYVDLMKKVFVRVIGFCPRLSYRIIVDKEHNGTQLLETENKEKLDQPVRTQNVNQPYGLLDAAQPQEIDSQLNTTQSFDTFIEGLSNKLSRSVGLSIAENPETTHFNPLFVYGPSGCGKTHLINAIGLKAKKTHPKLRILYVSARLFQVQYTNAVLQNSVNDFIHFYQTIDMLIVDDIQEWMTATRTQDTFFHIFNHLFRNGKRIILASDRPPVDLNGMNERLLTRFACGLIAELEKPDVKLCEDILTNKVRHDGLNIPHDVIQFIARTANGSVRDLEGVVNSLMAYSVVYNTNVDMALAQRILQRTVKVEEKVVTVGTIMDVVCRSYNVTEANISSKSRKREYVLARQVVMYLTQKHLKMPASKIGKLIGGRDHSTVIHSCAQVEQRLKTDEHFKDEIANLESQI